MNLQTSAPNHALQRTPGLGVQLPSAALIRPAQSRAVLPAMKPGTARAFALRRRAHSRAPGPESLSLGSLAVIAHPEMNHSEKSFYRIALLLLTCAFFTGCRDGKPPSPDATLVAENGRLIADNERLTGENTTLRKRNDELQTHIGNLKSHQGYLVLSTGVAVVAAIALFCVGLSVGMRIRRQHTQDESGPRPNSI
jgi:hypothetical protein